MKRLLPVLALVVMLSGCTSAPQPSEPTSVASSSPSAAAEVAPTTPASTPSALTTEQAATAYLDGVCPSNIAAETYNAEYDALVAAGSGADIGPLQMAAVALRDANQASAVAFSAPSTQWPAEVQADIAVIAASYFKDLADLDRLIQADSADALLAVSFSERTAEEKAAGPRVRTLLGLELDTQISCTGR